MGQPTEKQIAARYAAFFNMEMIQVCFTDKRNEFGEILETGLLKTGKMPEAWELLGTLSIDNQGASKFDAKFMSELCPDNTILLAEIFSTALVAGYGSVENMMEQGAFRDIEKNESVSTAIDHQAAPTFAKIFKPAKPVFH